VLTVCDEIYRIGGVVMDEQRLIGLFYKVLLPSFLFCFVLEMTDSGLDMN
jgi:hypothetical protein